MPTTEKETIVAEIQARIADNSVAIMTQYMGMNVAQATELRRRLRGAGAEFKVYKNTLARLALRELGLEQAAEFMEGPTAWAFSRDPVAPAKVLKEFSKDVPLVAMRGGVLTGSVVTAAQLDALANLPPREQLIAQVVGVIAAPLRNLVGVLSAPTRNLVTVVDQLRQQREEAQAA